MVRPSRPPSLHSYLGISKKIKKLIKSEKNNRKSQTVKKNRLNQLEYLKKMTDLVRFWFHKPETEKPNRTEINNWVKPEKTEPNGWVSVFVLK
jgi:hypothetical protein